MPIGNLVVLGFIVAAFAVFVIVLAAVTWWTEQTPRRLPARTADEPAAPTPAARLKS